MDTTLIFALLSIILFCLLIFFFKWRAEGSEKKYRNIKIKLNELKNLFSQKESNSRDLIVRLDTLLNKTLQLYFGNNLSCGENLKKAKPIFTKNEYQKIWEVHKLRNKVVHDDITISSQEAKKAYNVFYQSINKIINH